MSYITIKQPTYARGKPEHIVDVQRFATDLAKELGGKMLAPGEHMADRHAEFSLDAFTVAVSVDWRANGKATIRATPAGFQLAYNCHSKETKLPDATVSVDRPMKALAADVRRRVIEPAAAPAAAIREACQKHAAQIAAVKKAAEVMGATYPQLDVRREEGNAYQGTFYARGNGHGISGSYYADGRVHIDRIDHVTAEQFAAIVKIVGRDGPKATK